jgi:hypothetical protein
VQVYVPVVIDGVQCRQYTRAESDHRVINNRKVIENLQCLEALDPLTQIASSMI